VYEYAQAQAAYHAYKSGMAAGDTESMMYTNPIAHALVSAYRNTITSLTESILMKTVDTKRKEMISANKERIEIGKRKAEAAERAKYRLHEDSWYNFPK
jgi:hypothetical protein